MTVLAIAYGKDVTFEAVLKRSNEILISLQYSDGIREQRRSLLENPASQARTVRIPGE